MKTTILGIRRQKGIASKTGNPYDIAMLIVTTPIENVSNEKLQLYGKGFETSSMPYDIDKESFFMSMEYPAQVELETESRPRFGGFEVVAIGARDLKKAASQG